MVCGKHENMTPAFFLTFLSSLYLSLSARRSREAEIVFMDFPPEFSQEEKSSHLASSIEDLSVLFLHEVEAFNLVERSIKEIENIKEAGKLKKKLDSLLSKNELGYCNVLVTSVS